MYSSEDIIQMGNDVRDAIIKRSFATGCWDYDFNNMQDWWEDHRWGSPSREQKQEWAMAELDEIPQRFAEFTDVEPAEFDNLISWLQSAKTRIQSRESCQLDSIELSSWQGYAKESFVENYVAPFPGLRNYHLDLIEVLMANAAGHQELVREMRRTVMAIGEATIEAVHNGGDHDEAGMDGTTKGVVAIAALLSTVPGLGTSLNVFLSIVGVISTFAENYDAKRKADQEKKIKESTDLVIPAGTFKEIMDEMFHQLKKTAETVEQERSELARNASETINFINDQYGGLVPPPSKLAGIDPSDPGKALYYAD